MDQPLLRLALLGFDEAQTQRLTAWAGTALPERPIWRVVAMEQADAWCVAGPAVKSMEQGMLSVRTGLARQPLIKLNPAEMERPVAFGLPLPAGLQVAASFDAASEAGFRASLQRLVDSLRVLRSQFALSTELARREDELRPEIYHVSDGGQLLAVVDLVNWQVGFLPTLRPAELGTAAWDRRPPGAADIPNTFIKLSVTRLMWVYASRVQADVLPPRYRKHVIYLRSLPDLPVSWMHDEHLLLLRELHRDPANFDDLRLRTSLPAETLAPSLGALYFSGCLTTNPDNAGQIATQKIKTPRQPATPAPVAVFVPGMRDDDAVRMPANMDPTAPAPLGLR